MKRRRDLMQRLRAFDELSDAEKIAARLEWLEQSMVGVLWLLVTVTSGASGILVVWMVGDTIKNKWLVAAVFVFVFVVVGWWVHRRAFREAPPQVDLIDPKL